MAGLAERKLPSGVEVKTPTGAFIRKSEGPGKYSGGIYYHLLKIWTCHLLGEAFINIQPKAEKIAGKIRSLIRMKA